MPVSRELPDTLGRPRPGARPRRALGRRALLRRWLRPGDRLAWR